MMKEPEPDAAVVVARSELGRGRDMAALADLGQTLATLRESLGPKGSRAAPAEGGKG